MADSYIQVAADGSGKKMQTVVNTVGADSVHAEVVTLADTTGTAITTLPVSAVSLPLPSAAATSTKQSDGTQKTQIVDGSGNVIGSTSNAVDENLKSVGGGAVSTAATGVQKVGVVGNAGVAMDGTTAAGTAPTNALATLVQYKNTPPAPSDAQTIIPQADQAGNSRVTY